MTLLKISCLLKSWSKIKLLFPRIIYTLAELCFVYIATI